MPCWVAFDESGRQVFCTYEERLANMDDMIASGRFDMTRCSMERVDSYDHRSGMVCRKDMETGVIRMEPRPAPENKTASP